MLSSLDSITYRNRMFRLEPSDWAHEVMGGCGKCLTRQELAVIETTRPVTGSSAPWAGAAYHLRYGKTTL